MTRNTETETKFKTDTTYEMRSLCDHSCVWIYTVSRRTAKSVWLQLDRSTIVEMFRISQYKGVEQVSPLGKYSMSPVLSADHPHTES